MWIIKKLIQIACIFRQIFDTLSDVIYALIYEKSRLTKLPPIQDEILLLPATTLASKIRGQVLTSEQVVGAFIKRTNEVNKLTNAVVDTRFEEALNEAKEVDDIIANAYKNGTIDELAKTKPFLGVPFTTKDCFAVQGLSYTAGLLKRGKKNVKGDFDADVVKQLKQAGGVPLAVTNVSELCMWMESYNKVYGRTNNPYHLGRIPGGSSGGEASNLASGSSPMGIGSDVGGSIRMPAFFNGIFGHKPSTGLVSNQGQIPVAYGVIDTFLVTGPMSRFASDLLPLFKVLLKPDLTIDLKLDQPVDLKTLKVFYMEDDGGSPLTTKVHSELRTIQNELISRWQKTHGVTPVKLELKKMYYSALIWSNMMASEPSAPSFGQELTGMEGELNAPKELLKWILRQSDHTLPAIGLALTEKLINTETSMHKKFVKMGHKLQKELDEILGPNGILLYPSHPTPAPYHGLPILRTFNFSYTGIFNVLGNPVTQVPLGLGTWGVPLGIQVVGRRNNDRNCLAMALELEKMVGGWIPPS